MILVIFYSLGFSEPVETKNSKYNKKWFTFGLGMSSQLDKGSSARPSYNMSMNFASKKNTIEIKYTYIYASGIFTESLSRLYDFGILYGFKPNFKYVNLTCSGGISLVGGYQYVSEYNDTTGTYDENPKSIFTVGFPFELQFDWNTFTKFGIGLSVFGDLNFEKSFYGASLNFNIGTVR